ncbi:polyprenyl synthetase family protein [Leptospira sp. GIMC2001]|uniref:polyprenyl synthetase family protein n=1 Tax=Leptospira sp. GIMC2001 TaxID=1513297 RepID=UPI00234A6BF0|nr:polyprenyl synthetase family protein [Leptospira sp. GIMC2001]WCL49817.1 polyprenyl synthetase family protein [Leptospira sp. GIMC2001]
MQSLSKDFSRLVTTRRSAFEDFFASSIHPLIRTKSHERLAQAMIYSLDAGGKKIRPILTISSYLASNQSLDQKSKSQFHSTLDSTSNPDSNKISSKDSILDSNNTELSIQEQNVLYLASACELIHTYSLIHDDLPAMDDDDLRRGLPTCHVKFSESTAILAGDALNSLGFYLISKVKLKSEEGNSVISDADTLHADLLEILHAGAGMDGMVSGQSEDLEMEGKFSTDPKLNSIDVLERIHKRKTGALIIASLLLGNRLREDYKSRENLVYTYGEKLGLLFQMTDDILDHEGTKEELGKTPGKDAKGGKLTYVSHYGLEEAKSKVKNLIDDLVILAQELESQEEIFFKNLPIYIGLRKN